ncbi:MAG: FxsA family protein [Alphaproteobacteria bacterium]|nr:FxsA family protein [Alphaproteobacteria bacterium]MCB9690421.1 FxsA family protein [Alphaproteobacteria bacterium]
MLIRLFLLFTIVPAVELFLLLQLGALIGPFPTFMIVVLTGMVGAYLAKREGLGVMMELREELQRGIPPGHRLAEGVLVLVGGVLLVTPGVLTDLTGFALIFPLTRRWLAPRLVQAVLSRVDVKLGSEVDAMGDDVGYEGPVRRREPHRPQQTSHAPTPFSSPFDDLP